MSLLAELLSKVKNQGIKRDVPPSLKQVVEDSSEKAAIRKKVTILSVLVLVAVVTGFGAVYFLDIFVKLQQPSSVERRASSVHNQQPSSVERHASSVQNQTSGVAPAPSSPRANTVVQAQAEHKKAVSKRHKKVFALARKLNEEAESDTGLPPAAVKPPLRPSRAVIPLTPRNLTKEERESRDMHLYAAKNFESVKDYKHALSNYMQALGLEPGNYLIMNNISGIMLLMGRNNEALLYAGNALAHNQDYVPALINMGIASIKLNNAADGKKYLTRAFALDPSNKNTLLNLAILHEQTGDYEKAYSSFYKLAQSGDVRGYLGLARVDERKGDGPDAARVYREILSMNNIDPKIRNLASERLSQIESKTN